MPRFASLRNYFEELPRDLTEDYIRQVLCSRSKGAEGKSGLPYIYFAKMNGLFISAGACGGME